MVLSPHYGATVFLCHVVTIELLSNLFSIPVILMRALWWKGSCSVVHPDLTSNLSGSWPNNFEKKGVLFNLKSELSQNWGMRIKCKRPRLDLTVQRRILHTVSPTAGSYAPHSNYQVKKDHKMVFVRPFLLLHVRLLALMVVFNTKATYIFGFTLGIYSTNEKD